MRRINNTTSIQLPRSPRMTGFGSPCGACKFLRRKCVKGCVFAPYFCHEQGAAHFAAIHKVFGASNVSKLLMHLPVNDRSEAAVTVSYEAQARIRDPIYGCVAHIFALQQQVVNLQAQLESLKAQAAQGYANGSSISSPEEDDFKHAFMPYLQDEQGFFQQGGDRMPQPTALNSSVKNESHLYFGDDLLTSTSMQSSQGYKPHFSMPENRASFDNDSNPCTMFSLDMQENVQRNACNDMEDLQSVAFAYLNQAWQDDAFGS